MANTLQSVSRRPTGSTLVKGLVLLAACGLAHVPELAPAQEARNRRAAARQAEPEFPPVLPDGQQAISVTTAELLKPPENLREGVAVAKAPPTVDFLYYPGQNYPGKPWSNWGDGSVAGGKYYSAIGDHLAIGVKGDGTHGTGTALVFAYDPQTKSLQQLADVARLLDLPEGHYTPGKIHSRIEMGRDGWVYFATHRGSEKAAIDENHYLGDWILRCNPSTGAAEVVARGPVSKHSIPCSTLDPERLIFYGATAAGPDAAEQSIHFFAYDLASGKLLCSIPDGPSRYMIFARSTGRVYYVPGRGEGPLLRVDPRSAATPVNTGQTIGLRAATQETPQGFVYTVSSGQRTGDAAVWSFNTKTERARQIGSVAVGGEAYVASIDADPSGRYLYYVPGAHGGSDRDGSPLVQFDVTTGQKKVIAFLEPYFTEAYGCTMKGTYSTAVSESGDKVFISWNVSRGSKAWDCCALMVVHVPESERAP